MRFLYINKYIILLEKIVVEYAQLTWIRLWLGSVKPPWRTSIKYLGETRTLLFYEALTGIIINHHKNCHLHCFVGVAIQHLLIAPV